MGDKRKQKTLDMLTCPYLLAVLTLPYLRSDCQIINNKEKEVTTMYNEWHEHIGFTGWNCAIGVSQWDAEEEEEPP